MNKLIIFLLFLSLFGSELFAQREPDMMYSQSIKSVKLTKFGDQLSYPVIGLNSSDQLELHFDDMEGGVKNYFYSIVLCNADWKPAQMSYFDYAKGFTQVRIATYRNSAIALTRYTHYQANFPDRNLQPTKSGNYMLRVFVNGDTSKLVFTKRFLVVDAKLSMSAQVLQPSNQQLFLTHHRLQLQLNTRNFDVRYPQQQIRIRVLQNLRWDNSLFLNTPTFIRPDQLQYSNETEMTMPAGKEYRWLNLRSFRLLGDRVQRQENTDKGFELFVKEDLSRLPRQYFYYRDLNGLFINETIENINPFWNADYAKVHFRFKPPGSMVYPDAELVIMGELTNYGKDPNAKMIFNAEQGVYETTLLLKQGYYDYQYSLNKYFAGKEVFDETLTEQNAWETENQYLILVYYRPLGGRYDELVAIRQISSQFNSSLR